MKNNKTKQKKTFYRNFFKRFLDISISLTAIIILSPILLLLYLLNGLFVGFPTIFKQPRPGKNNKIFYIYKFRSMNNKKDKDGNLLPDSQRITTWGKFMRKTSLDELPQLFNILSGKMSIIGFRPRLVKDVLFYDKAVFDNYTATPGLTGPIQTSSRNESSWEEIFESDKEYMNNISFKNDIKLFFKTFVSVFTKQGESHDNAEEDKPSKRDYYYADYLLRTGKISKAQYDYGMALAKDIIENKKPLEYHPELLDLELFNEMNNHKHAIIILKNKNNELLQYYDNDWKSLLFLNCKLTQDDFKQQVIDYIASTLSINAKDINCKLKTNKVHKKFSVTAQKDKIYNHYFFEITINNRYEFMTQKEFNSNNINYSWHSIKDLEKDLNVQNVNADIVTFVKEIIK